MNGVAEDGLDERSHVCHPPLLAPDEHHVEAVGLGGTPDANVLMELERDVGERLRFGELTSQEGDGRPRPGGPHLDQRLAIDAGLVRGALDVRLQPRRVAAGEAQSRGAHARRRAHIDGDVGTLQFDQLLSHGELLSEIRRRVEHDHELDERLGQQPAVVQPTSHRHAVSGEGLAALSLSFVVVQRDRETNQQPSVQCRVAIVDAGKCSRDGSYDAVVDSAVGPHLPKADLAVGEGGLGQAA